MHIYAMHDTKTGAYKTPFCTETEYEAMRQVMAAVGDDRTELSKFPADFDLVFLGEFDPHRGVLSPSVHVTVGNAAALYAAYLRTARRLKQEMEGTDNEVA